jgi:hypothetical protein
MRTTTRQLHARITAAEAQISAMLFFTVARTKKPSTPSQLRYQRNNTIKGLAHLADILHGTAEPDFLCEGCSKPITNGQHYSHDPENSIYFHARCYGLKPSQCGRMDTAREIRQELKRRRADARVYLERGK